MNQKKKKLVTLGVVSLVAISSITLFAYQFYPEESPPYTMPPNHLATDYAQEKYGFEVDVVDKRENGYDSTHFFVSPKKDKDVVFTVTVSGENSEEFEDDYENALLADKEFKKLKPFIPAIEKLGFTGEDGDEIRLGYSVSTSFDYVDETHPYLNLESDKVIDYETFVEEDFDTYYTLYKLVKESQANLVSFSVSNPYGMNEFYSTITFDVSEPDKVKSKAELLTELKTTYPDIVGYEVENRLAKEAEAMTNDRFHFGSNYKQKQDDPIDSWFVCSELNQKTECTSGFIDVTYQKDSLNKENPYLKEDLIAIFDFAEKHLEPEIKVEAVFFEGSDSSGEELMVNYEEWEQYEDIDELIEVITNRDE